MHSKGLNPNKLFYATLCLSTVLLNYLVITVLTYRVCDCGRWSQHYHVCKCVWLW